MRCSFDEEEAVGLLRQCTTWDRRQPCYTVALCATHLAEAVRAGNVVQRVNEAENSCEKEHGAMHNDIWDADVTLADIEAFLSRVGEEELSPGQIAQLLATIRRAQRENGSTEAKANTA